MHRWLLGRRLVRTYDVLTVLAFALTASFLYDMRLDFAAEIDWTLAVKFVLITLASVSFHGISGTMQETAEYVIAEFSAEKDIEHRAGSTIDQRFDHYIAQMAPRLLWRVATGWASLLMFFILAPAVSILS